MAVRAFVAVVALAGMAACGGKSTLGAPEGAPNVLLISIDTQRADRLGFYGYARPTSPHLDAFAAGGVVFEEAEGAAPWTLPALASVMTGEVLSTHQCWDYGSVLDDSFRTLAEHLLAAGYDTACVVSHLFTTSRHGLQQGFVHTDDTYAYPEGDPELNVTSQVITDKGIRFLVQKHGAPERAPWFLWLHYFDPHREYMPHPGISEQFVTPGTRSQGVLLGDIYDGEVRFTDENIGRLLERLRELDLEKDTLIVLLADHGEEFLDHGGLGHGHSMHREIVHVPLVFRGLGLAPRRVPELARQIDVLPTVLELLHLSAPGELPGRSLVPALRGGTLGGGADFGALAEQDNPNTHLDSWRTQRYRLIRSSADGSRQLFDLQADPLELHDVAAEQPELVQQLEAELERAKAAGQARARLYGEAREVTLTPGVQDDLRKLGYAGNDDAEASGAKAPADRVPRK